jgi:hypothetical protein
MGPLQGGALADCSPGGPAADSIGLIGASGFVIAMGAASNIAFGVLVLAAAFLSYVTRLNPAWMFGAAALIGLTGLL